MRLAADKRRRIAFTLPLVVVWLLAVWPFVLWLAHRSDPVLAVHLADGAASALRTTAWWSAIGFVALCLLHPPLPAWLRLVGHRAWRRMSTPEAPLRQALAALAQFESAARHLDVARLAFQRQLPQASANHAARAIALDPSPASAWHLLGLSLVDLGKLDDALHAFEQAEARDPGHAFGEALLQQGRLLFLRGDPAGLALLQEHERRHGGGARSHLWLAEALDRAGDRVAATAALRTAAAKPNHAASLEERLFRARARARLRFRGGDR